MTTWAPGGRRAALCGPEESGWVSAPHLPTLHHGPSSNIGRPAIQPVDDEDYSMDKVTKIDVNATRSMMLQCMPLHATCQLLECILTDSRYI